MSRSQSPRLVNITDSSMETYSILNHRTVPKFQVTSLQYFISIHLFLFHSNPLQPKDPERKGTGGKFNHPLDLPNLHLSKNINQNINQEKSLI